MGVQTCSLELPNSHHSLLAMAKTSGSFHRAAAFRLEPRSAWLEVPSPNEQMVTWPEPRILEERAVPTEMAKSEPKLPTSPGRPDL